VKFPSTRAPSVRWRGWRSMLLSEDDRILVQGITGREATAMCEDMMKGGQAVHDVPVFDTVHEAVEKTGATVTVVSVPAPAVLDASLEAFSHGIKLCLIMSERVPRIDTCKLVSAAKQFGCRVIGPNTLGLIRPGIAKLGTIGGRVDNVKRSFKPGRVAVLSRSGGMTTEIASFLTSRGIGQSLAVGVGGDPIIGSNFFDLIEMLEEDESTDAVILYGEPGGTAEEQLAERLKRKPSRLRVNAFLSGRFVDDLEGVRFGHAAVIVEGGRGSVKGKMAALREAGVFVAERFDEIVNGLN
jgi:succinyl-CoA synthetase alpha subunit